MPQDDLELEQRLARFEAQLDRFSLTLRDWQHTRDEHRLAADPQDVERRIRALEETLDREARALRKMHEEPLKQLQAHASTLTDICIAAKHSVEGLDQAESRLAALQTDLHLHLTELSRNFQTLAADLRAAGPTAMSAPGPSAAWPLDRVVDVHNELRRAVANGPGDGASGAGEHAHRAASRQDAVDAAERMAVVPERRSPWWFVAAAAAVAMLIAVGYSTERKIDARLNDATARAAAAEQQAEKATQAADRQVTSTREQADREIAEARKSAQRAETIGAVLTAPDLVRFALTGVAPDQRLSAQVLWSRSRGVVLSASRLPVAPADTNYQLWLWANGSPVSAGVFVPDATGRATLVNDAPPKLAGPVANVEVTVEPNGGRTTPTGRTLLARLQ